LRCLKMRIQARNEIAEVLHSNSQGKAYVTEICAYCIQGETSHKQTPEKQYEGFNPRIMKQPHF